MLSGRATALLFVLGTAATATTVGCFTEEAGGTISENNEIRDPGAREAKTVLESTLLLASGCTAARVGPRHLIVAARCVVGHEEVVAGGTLEYEIAQGRTAKRREQQKAELEPLDGGAADADVDASSDSSDAGVAPAKLGPTIERVVVNPTYEAKCAGDKCAFGSLAASDAKDVAVIILEKDLGQDIPTIPVDLDAVKEGATLVAVGGACRTLDDAPRRERLTPTLALPAKVATHRGSVYEKAPALVSRLDQSYVVTAGRGWRSGDPGLCRTDIGAPLFRSGGTVAVAGITAGFTYAQADDPLPVTLHHTRLDTGSEVGPWLESLGVETVHACSGSGCVKTTVSDAVPTIAQMDEARRAPDLVDEGEESDGGLVAEDGGDAGSKRGEMSGKEVELGEGTDEGYSSSDPVYADAGRPKKNKIVPACASTSGPVRGGSPFAFAALGLALVSLARRRGGPRRG